MGPTLTLWTTTFAIEESETEFKLRGGQKLKLHLHTSITVNIKVTHYFLQDLNLFTWSWELSSFKCWHSQSQTLNQKLNLKRFKKKKGQTGGVRLPTLTCLGSWVLCLVYTSEKPLYPNATVERCRHGGLQILQVFKFSHGNGKYIVLMTLSILTALQTWSWYCQVHTNKSYRWYEPTH